MDQISRRLLLKTCPALFIPGKLLDYSRLTSGLVSTTTGSDGLQTVVPVTPGDALGYRAQTLATQILQHRSYFGKPMAYVPSSTYAELSAQLGTPDSGLLHDLNAEFQVLQPLIDAKQSRAITLAHLDQIKNTLIAEGTALTAKFAEYNTEVGVLDAQIALLKPKVLAQYQVVIDVDAKAQYRYSQDSMSCNLKVVLLVAAVIVEIVVAVYTAASDAPLIASDLVAIAGTATEVSTVAEALSDLEILVSDYLLASADIKDLVGKYRTLEDLLNGDLAKGRIAVAAQDALTLKAKFDDSVARSSLTDASKSELLLEAHKYFDLSSQLNRLTLERDGRVLQIRLISESILTTATLRDKAVTDINLKVNPDQDHYVGVIDRILNSVVEDSKKVLWSERRAIALYELAVINSKFLPEPPIDTRSTPHQADSSQEITYLESVQTSYKDKMDLFTDDNRSYKYESRKQFTSTAVDFQLRLIDVRGVWRFDVEISKCGIPQSLNAIAVELLTVAIPGASNFQGQLIHSGIHQVLTPNGELRVFESDELVFDLSGAQTPGNLFQVDCNSLFAPGLSPYGTWTLKSAVDLDPSVAVKIQSVSLVFTGNGIAQASTPE